MKTEQQKVREKTVLVGKSVLNMHLSIEEHEFVKDLALKNSMSVTMVIRNMIRREMQKAL